MATFIEMQDAILDDFVNESLTPNQVVRAIRRAIANYEGTKFWFTQQEGSFATVASQEYYSDTDFDGISGMSEIVEMLRDGVQMVPLAVGDDELCYGSSGMPMRFTCVGKQLRLNPVPDGVYTIKMTWWGKLPELVNDEDENGWTTTAEELIHQAAKVRIALDTLHNDEAAQRAGRLEAIALDALSKENRQRSAHVKVRASQVPITRSSFNILTGV